MFPTLSSVPDLVVELTDDKSLPEETRKEKQAETAHQKSPRAKILKLAHKTSNLRAIATSPAKPTEVKLFVRLGDVEASYVSCARSSDVSSD
jgi:hypothetical protein